MFKVLTQKSEFKQKMIYFLFRNDDTRAINFEKEKFSSFFQRRR